VSHYSKITSRFWTGTTGRAIRGDLDAQVVAMYLLTNSHTNMLGYYYLPVAYISNDTGIPIEGASKGLRRLCEEGFCRYDEASEVVWVVEMAKVQIGASLEAKDKRVIAVTREYESLPNNAFLDEFYRMYGKVYHIKKRRSFEGPSQAPSKPVAVAVAVAVTTTAAVTTSATATRVAPPSRSSRPEKPTEAKTTAAWNAYAEAYRQRYGVDPIADATVRSQLSKFIDRVGQGDAPNIAAFYVRHNKAFYVSRQHPVGLLLTDAEGLRTQWLNGRVVTDTEARQADRKQNNLSVAEQLIAEARLSNASQ
jgi:hypothetical protein